MVGLSLWKRFIASILDKVCIFFLWVMLLNFVVYTPYTASGKLGTYSCLITIPPSNYEYIDIGAKNRQRHPENNYGVSEGYRSLQELDLANMKPEKAKDTDIKITIWFILTNFIYYLLGEILCGASFFKRIFGGTLAGADGSEVKKSRLLVRNIALGIILTLCVLLHFLLNISYLLIVITFFIIFELPLFRTRQNCLDKVFGNYLVKRSCLNVDSKLANNERDGQQSQNVTNEVLNKKNTAEEIDTSITQIKYKTKSSRGIFKPTTLLMFVFGLVALFCIHQLVWYFLGDYYNPANYYFDNNSYAHIETKNLQRKYLLSRNLFSYDSERFLASQNLGRAVSRQQWLDKELGNIPLGQHISSYCGTGLDDYYAGERRVTRYYPEVVPRYRTVDFGYGYKRTFQDGWERKNVPYTCFEPVWKSYYWSYALSTFDISDQISFFENEDSAYSKYLKNIEVHINANYDFDNHYTEVGGVKAFAYYTTDEGSIKRVIFCANKRVYFLEVKSPIDLDFNSAKIADTLYLKEYGLNQKDRNSLIAYFVCFVTCCSILFVCCSRKRKKYKILNKYSDRLCKCAIAAAFINCVIFAVQLYCLFTLYTVNFNAAIVLVLSSFSILFVDFPLYRYYYKKALIEYHYDYIIPDFFKKYVYNKISNEINKKLYITFVGYPMMVILLTPMGLVILPYIVISQMLSTLAVYISRWNTWIGTSSEKSRNDQISIVNYYSVLGVSKTSNTNDINIAYNAIVAKINMSLNTPSFDPAYFAQVQEAFFIIGDSENIRKIYDDELRAFESCTNPATYVIKNVVLLDMIKKFRQSH